MTLDKNRLIECWQKWNKPKSDYEFTVKLIQHRWFEHNLDHYSYDLIEKQKDGITTIYDFICECSLVVDNVWEDDFFNDAETLKLVKLTDYDFQQSIRKVFNRGSVSLIENDFAQFIDLNKSPDILAIIESWDWSTYVIEYHDKWQFLSIDIIW